MCNNQAHDAQLQHDGRQSTYACRVNFPFCSAAFYQPGAGPVDKLGKFAQALRYVK